MRNDPRRAVAAADKALKTSNSAEVRFLAGRILIDGGEVARAKPLAAALAKELSAEPLAYGRILEGEIALKSGDARQAVVILTEANKGLDTWLGHFDLGRAYLTLGQHLEADSEFDTCIRRKGEALSLLVDESPTFGYFPIVYYYQGQVREAMKTTGFADRYREYLKIRGDSTEDRLVSDASRRAR